MIVGVDEKLCVRKGREGGKEEVELHNNIRSLAPNPKDSRIKRLTFQPFLLIILCMIWIRGRSLFRFNIFKFSYNYIERIGKLSVVLVSRAACCCA